MFKYIQITNVSHVTGSGPDRVAHWAQFLLIDRDRGDCPGTKQIRGFTYGGLPVFTYWIGNEPVEVKQDGTLKIGKLELMFYKQDQNKPFSIKEISVDACPWGASVDEEILKFYKAPNYCLATAYVPKEQALELSKKFSPKF